MAAASIMCRKVYCTIIRGLRHRSPRSIPVRQPLQFHVRRAFGFLRNKNRITSIPVSLLWIWPLYAIGGSFGHHQSVATQASSNQDELAEEILGEILCAVRNDPASSRKIFDTHIPKLCITGNLVVIAQLLQSLRNEGIFLSAKAYNILLDTAGEGGDIHLTSQIFKDLLVSFDALSSSTYHNIAKAFKKADDCVLLRFVKDVSELTFPRSASVLNRIIFAFAECGQIVKALLIFDHMKSLKCKPDLVTYNTVLAILGRSGRVEEMLHEFASMKEVNISPDIVTYNTLLNSLRNMGKLELCLALFKDMDDREIEPDVLTYTALIENFGRAGDVETSLKLFYEMKQRCIHPSIYIYRSLINNLKKVGNTKLASEFLNEMNNRSDLLGPKEIKRKRR